MHRILAIDEQLTLLFTNFEQIADELDMPLVCSLSDHAIIKKQMYPGIYRIDVSTAGSTDDFAAWIETFQAEWAHEDFKKKFTANFKLKRIAFHRKLSEQRRIAHGTQLSEWMPLYIGKSQKVGARVLEHIQLGLDKTTFALKLNARPSMTNRKFRLHAIELRVKNYNLVAPVLESALRERFHPLIGKQ